MVEAQSRQPLPNVEQRPNLVAVPAQNQSDGQMAFDAVSGEDEVLFRISSDALIGEDDLVSEANVDESESAGATSDEAGKAVVAAEPEVAVVAAEPEVAESEPDAVPVTLIADLEAQPAPFEPPPAAPVDDPALQARLARIHLRTGSLTLARAELETLSGRNQLDTAGRLDLAEARWRTGDLRGAGEAASAYLAADGEEVLGFVIAAEAAAMANRIAEAKHYVAQAMERYLSDLDPIFAGMARKAMWSAVVASPAAVSAAEPAPELVDAAPERAVEPAPEFAVEPAPEPAPEPVMEDAPQPGVAVESAPEPVIEPAAATAQALEDPTVAQADGEVASGRSYLEGNDPLLAALHFGVALRLNQTRASVVIEVIGDRQDAPLQLVRDEAVRLRDEAVRLRDLAGAADLASQPTVIEPSAPMVEAPPPPPPPSPPSPPSAPAVEPAVEPEPPAQPHAPELPPIRWD